MRAILLTMIVLASVGPKGRADQAVRPDGRTVGGRIVLGKSGAVGFCPTGGTDAVPLAGFTGIRPEPTALASPRASPAMRLRLVSGEEFTGAFLGLEKDRVSFRTSWADRLVIPRAAVRSLTPLPGWQPLLLDDLAGKRSAWTPEGKPPAQGVPLRLDQAGQGLRWLARPPLPAGRIGVTIHPLPDRTGGRWVLEAHFTSATGVRVVRVVFNDRLTVETGGLEGRGWTVPFTTQPQRVLIIFTPSSLRITRDNEGLWTSPDAGPGALREVRLTCLSPVNGTGRSGLEWSSFAVERSVPVVRRPPGEPDRDEVWLAGGEQLFGTVERIDRTGVKIRGRFGVRRFDWTALRGWYPRRQRLTGAPDERKNAVRLELSSGERSTPDVLEGVLTRVDGPTWTLTHPHLGEVVIPRGRVLWVRPLGRR